MESFVIYKTASALYFYITQIHKEPSTSMLFGAVFMLLAALKICQCAYTVYTVGRQTERTPENWDHLMRSFKIVSFIHFLASAAAIAFLKFHALSFSKKFGHLPAATTLFIHYIMIFIGLQAGLFIVIYALTYSIKKSEDQ